MNTENAPCDLGRGTGEAYTVNPDTKDGLCACDFYACAIDSRNKVLQRFRQGQTPFDQFADQRGHITHKRLKDHMLSL